MKIQFKDKHLRALCEDRFVASRTIGPIGARKLEARLAEIRLVSRVSDLRLGSPHPLKGNRAGQFAVDLSGGWRLVFSPVDERSQQRCTLPVDWSAVAIICIEFIGDYHD